MYKVVLRKMLAQTDTPFNDPFYVLEFLEEVFMRQHWERLLLFTPEETKEWAEEMVTFWRNIHKTPHRLEQLLNQL